MEYAHWLIVVGAVLLVLGFIGFALHKNDAEPAEGHLTPDTSSETIPAAESFAASCRAICTRRIGCRAARAALAPDCPSAWRGRAMGRAGGVDGAGDAGARGEQGLSHFRK